MRKIVTRSLAALVGLVLIASVLGLLWLRSSVSDYDDRQAVNSLSANVTIVRDGSAVPHIFAQSLDDALVGLGYVHAQDRLWQLELMKRVAGGRLAELIGEDGLQYDQLSHAMNLTEMGRITGERMDEKTRAAIASYVAGINAYIESHAGAWPLEFVLLGAEPTRWTVADCLNMSGVTMLGVPNWEDELVNAKLEALVGRARLAEFLPRYPADAPVTHKAHSAASDDAALQPVGMASWPFRAGGFASNTWAVGGSRTMTGKPILASDPHGGLSAPTDYYLARMVGPDFELAGASFPGIPGILLGTNGHIAWGLTDMMADISDLFVERFVDADLYDTPDGPTAVETREVTLPVKGGDEHTIVIRETRHGPLISDFHDDAAEVARRFGENHAIALAIDGLDNGNLMIRALMGYATAKNWDEFVIAAADWEIQHNFSFAAVDGSVGIVSASRVPVRPPGSLGLFPAKGWTGTQDWLGVLSSEELPRTFNPPAGYIFNTNNKLEPPGYAHVLSRGYSPPFRAIRAEELLSNREQHDLASIRALQLDTVSTAARHILPLLLNVEATDALAESAISMLRDWDGDMSADRGEGLIYTAWIMALSEVVYADEFGEMYDKVLDARTLFLADTLRTNSSWCDDQGTTDLEDCPLQLSRSLGMALETLREHHGDDATAWRWGDAHDAQFANDILTGVPLLSRLSDASVGVGGNSRTLNSARAEPGGAGTFPATFGSRYRQIIDLSDPGNNRFMIAPGVSGNVFSPYYKHLVHMWADGEYLRLHGSLEDLKHVGIGTTELYPPH